MICTVRAILQPKSPRKVCLLSFFFFLPHPMHTGSDWSMQCCSEPQINSFTGWIDTKGDREKGRKEGGQKELFLSLSCHNAQRPPRCLVIQRLLLDRAVGMIRGSRQSSCTKTAALLGCKQDPSTRRNNY